MKETTIVTQPSKKVNHPKKASKTIGKSAIGTRISALKQPFIEQ